MTYPLCIEANPTRHLYEAYEANDVSMVIDREGIVRYRGAGVNTTAINGWIDQLLTTSVSDDKDDDLPYTFTLSQNYPNPFNPATVIEFEIPRKQNVSLQIYDLQGRLVKDLLDAEMNPGRHALSWNGIDRYGRQAASGIYIYRLKSGSMQQTRKMTLIR